MMFSRLARRILSNQTFYTATHEWVTATGPGKARIGITDFAQDELGEVVFVDAGKQGKSLKKGESVCTVESVKAVGEVYAPFPCTVTAVNPELGSNPKLVNDKPENEGWLVELGYTGDFSALTKGLKDSKAYLNSLPKKK